MSADERRESVLEAALIEFAGRGLDGTSTEDVARRAGISQPYLFRLFPTKKALFVALVDRCFQRVAEAFATAAADRVGEEALEGMGEAYEQLLEDRTLLLLQMQDARVCGVRRPGHPHRYSRRIPGAVAAGRAADRAAVRPGHPVLRHGTAD
jgi:AcrR family transcriptional regulator